MKAGYVKVSIDANSTAAGKIRKVRCGCNDGYGFDRFPGVAVCKVKYNYFMNQEVPTLDEKCPVCNYFTWYTI